MKLNLPIRIFSALLLVVAVTTNSGVAQEKLTDEERVSMAFELDVKRIRESKLVQAVGFDNLASQLDLEKDMTLIDPNHVDRLSGGIRWPDDLTTLTRMQPGDDFELSFYWLVEFNTPGAGDDFVEEAKNFLEEVERDGNTYYKIPDVENVFLQINDDHFLSCTENYLGHDFRNVFTPNLQESFSRLPQHHMAKAAIDFQANRKVIEEVLDMSDDELWMLLPFPPEFIGGIPNIHEFVDVLSASIDLSDEKVITAYSNSKDESSAIKFESELSQLLSMGRLVVMMGLSSAGITDEADKTTVNNMLNQFRPTREGTSNTVEISQPEGFEELLANVTVIMKKRADEIAKVNRFREAGLAVHNFHDSHRRLPFGDGVPGFSDQLSWRARVMPYTWSDEKVTFVEDEAWDSADNKMNAERMPIMYGPDKRNSRVCWIKSTATTLEKITDGTSNTVMLLENPAGTPWTQPGDLSILQAIKLIRNLEDGEKLVAVMYDCSTIKLDNSFTMNEIKAILTPNGGEVPPNDLWSRTR